MRLASGCPSLTPDVACRPWKGEEFKGLLVESVAEGAQTGALTLPGFLAKWAFTTALDPVRTLAYLRYLGYDGDAAPFFAISRPRRLERKSEQLSRSLLQVINVGASSLA